MSLAAGLASAFGALAAGQSAVCAPRAASVLERLSALAWVQPGGKAGPAAGRWGAVPWAVLAALISAREMLVGGMLTPRSRGLGSLQYAVTRCEAPHAVTRLTAVPV